ncbi:MAG: transferrin-binding protein-like solute binding protein, partial [Proteobacteria bacterium]|nr:transferrin-binding protein-like solute binding protein [Pseudomonadota bacterium]
AGFSRESITIVNDAGKGFTSFETGDVLLAHNDVPVVYNPLVALSFNGTFDLNGAPLDNTDINGYDERITFDIDSDRVESTFHIEANADKTLVMTINNVKYNLNRDGNTVNTDGRPIQGPRASDLGTLNRLLWLGRAPTGTTADIVDGTNTEVYGTYVSYDINSYFLGEGVTFDFIQGYTTIGIPTPISFFDNQTATATYTGTLALILSSENFTHISLRDRSNLIAYNAILNMNVNFDTDKISGRAAFRDIDDGKPYIPTLDALGGQDQQALGADIQTRAALGDAGILTLQETDINHNGFTGSFVMDQDALNLFGITNTPTGTYAGNFFGPEAQDLAGVLSINATTNISGQSFGGGGFQADRNPDAPSGN